MPSIASRLPGATDVLIDDAVNGRLFPVDDEAALVRALRDVLSEEVALFPKAETEIAITPAAAAAQALA